MSKFLQPRRPASPRDEQTCRMPPAHPLLARREAVWDARASSARAAARRWAPRPLRSGRACEVRLRCKRAAASVVRAAGERGAGCCPEAARSTLPSDPGRGGAERSDSAGSIPDLAGDATRSTTAAPTSADSAAGLRRYRDPLAMIFASSSTAVASTAGCICHRRDRLPHRAPAEIDRARRPPVRRGADEEPGALHRRRTRREVSPPHADRQATRDSGSSRRSAMEADDL